jgi:hypothetical protein
MAPSGPRLLADGAHCCGQEKAKPTQGHAACSIYHNALPRILNAPAPMQAVNEVGATASPNIQRTS